MNGEYFTQGNVALEPVRPLDHSHARISQRGNRRIGERSGVEPLFGAGSEIDTGWPSYEDRRVTPVALPVGVR